MTGVRSSEIGIEAADGYRLTARIYAGETKHRGVVLIVPAMGVPQTFYAVFASWLAGQGFCVFTFDYRGIGASRHGPLRSLKATVMDWAQLDAGAVLRTALQQASSLPVYWIGHSLGGQIIPLVPNSDRVRKVITVACGSGYWRENAPALKRVVWWMWYVAAPVSLRLFGYFPGKRLRKVGDLPYGVMAQWRRWCLHPEYVVGVEGPRVRNAYAAVNTPLTAISFTDDEYMSEKNVASLHGYYTNAPQQHVRLSPRELGMHRVGHFGFFRAESEQPLWSGWLLPALS